MKFDEFFRINWIIFSSISFWSKISTSTSIRLKFENCKTVSKLSKFVIELFVIYTLLIKISSCRWICETIIWKFSFRFSTIYFSCSFFCRADRFFFVIMCKSKWWLKRVYELNRVNEIKNKYSQRWWNQINKKKNEIEIWIWFDDVIQIIKIYRIHYTFISSN